MAKKLTILVLCIMAIAGFSLASAGIVFSSGSSGNAVVNAASLSPESGLQANASNHSIFTKQGRIDMINQLKSSFSAHNIPQNIWTLPSLDPNVGAPLSMVKGQYGPGYTQTPAPMGIADYGVKNTNGTYENAIFNTTALSGTINISKMSMLYLDPYGTNGFSVQLNAILHNVTLLGMSKYRFWTQNVIYYYNNTHTLVLIDFIDDFSPYALPTQNFVYKHGPDAGLITSSYYFGYLEYLTNVSFPFNLTLSMYSSVSPHGNDNLSMYYNLISTNTSTGKLQKSGGEFDYVDFNSTYGQPSSYRAPVAGYEIDESNDAEFIIGGPGGGSTTTVYDLNATMDLQYLNSTTGSFEYVPDAYDAGSETGETIQGISEYFTTPGIVHMDAGPSIIEPLWNTSGTAKNQGYTTVRGSIAQTSSFIFFRQEGRPSTMAWAPTPVSGDLDYKLIPGNYSIFVDLSYHNPVSMNISGASGTSFNFHINLPFNLSTGIYTPLYAFDNSQIKDLSFTGNGTVSNPYIIAGYSNQFVSYDGKIVYVQPEHILSRFSDFNDYLWPEFSGIFITGTHVYTVLEGFPNLNYTFAPYYTDFGYSIPAFFGLPDYNSLEIDLYYVSNLTIKDFHDITGWLYSDRPYISQLNLYDTSNVLVDGNTFVNQGQSILIYNTDNSTVTHNTVWGNRFLQDTQFADSPYSYEVNSGDDPIAMLVYSTGNLIYNNYFDVFYTAISPSNVYNPIQDSYYEILYPVNYTDTWNISAEPSYAVNYVNGIPLTGSIIGTAYQGGNYWYNYLGNGSMPYNDYGLVQSGNDSVPLTYGVQKVTFLPFFLPERDTWYAGIINPLSPIENGPVYLTNGTGVGGQSITLYVQNGFYTFSIGTDANALITPQNGTIFVNFHSIYIPVRFSLLYQVQVNFFGIPDDFNWTLQIVNTVMVENTTSFSLNLTNGTYFTHISLILGQNYMDQRGPNVNHKGFNEKYPSYLNILGFFVLSGNNVYINITLSSNGNAINGHGSMISNNLRPDSLASGNWHNGKPQNHKINVLITVSGSPLYYFTVNYNFMPFKSIYH